MFISHTVRETLNQLDLTKNAIAESAKQKGLVFGACLVNGNGYGVPALSGNTYQAKETLKQFGAKFNGQSKVWTFETLEKLSAAIAAI